MLGYAWNTDTIVSFSDGLFSGAFVAVSFREFFLPPKFLVFLITWQGMTWIITEQKEGQYFPVSCGTK